MTVKLTGNFLATARCLIYQDGNAITWSFNPNTNQLTAAYTGAGSAGSDNPTAKVGLTAVNGSTGAIVVQYGSAVAAAGAHAVGDWIKQSISVIGNPKGWRCTVAATPGTFTSEWNL